MNRARIISLVLFFSLGVFASGNFLFASEINADSRITEVTVYPDSALVSRSASIRLDAGRHKITFAGIIPAMDENSLRVTAGGDAVVKLLGAQVEKEFLEEVPSERIQQLKDKIEGVRDEIRTLQNTKSILAEEKNFLDSVRLFSRDQIPEDLVTKMPTAQDLEGTLNFLATKLRENFAAVRNADFEIRGLNRKLVALRKELSQISGSSRKVRRSIVVDLEVARAGTSDLKASYLVGGAYWRPIYDARADFSRAKVEMVSFGIIKQKTGEDWQDVQISLSTAKPAVGGRMPYVAPWILRPYQPPRVREARAERKIKASMLKQFAAFDEEAEEGLAVGDAKDDYSIAEEKGIAVVYKLSQKATIKADGSKHKLPISSQILSAKFEYSSYPRAILNAYLGSRVTNAPNLQLLAGRVNVFLEGDFVGTSSIDNVGPGEEFDLYLGVDENVKVKREQVEKKVDETLIAGIRSPTKRTTIRYKLTVENYKTRKVNVKLFEAMPIPEDDRIKVKIVNVSLEPNKKDWKERKGVWLWERELPPKAKQEIFYTCIIEHPREMIIGGL